MDEEIIFTTLNFIEMKNVLILLTIVFMLGCTSVATGPAESVIEKAKIEVVNGQFTPEMLHLFGKLSDIQLSPDGKEILYGVSYTDIEKNKGMRQLFIMNIDGSNNRQITNMPKSSANARWYGDGNQIVFLQGGQLQIINSDGTGLKQLSEIEGGIQSFEFSPSQKQILYIAEVKSAIKPTDLYPDLDKSTGRVINDLMYRHWDHFVENIPHTFHTSFNPEGGIIKGEDLVEGTLYELPTLPFSGLEQLAWSPSEEYIAYACRKYLGKEYTVSTDTDIYLYNVKTKEVKDLTDGMDGYDTNPVFSPDGKYIAWISMERAGFEADKHRLFIIDTQSWEKKELSIDYKYNVDSPVWNSTSDAIYFSSLVNAKKGVFEVDLNGEVKRITPEEAWYDFGGVIDAGDKLITTYTSLLQPSEIVSISKSDGSFTQLSNENTESIDKLADVKVEERWITTTDNKKMHTWVMFPPGFDETKKYPAILVCLGGPQGTISQGWSTRWNYRLMAAQGYIVVLPNRRGTTAFGQEWTDQISGDYIGQNMQDYLAAARNIKKEPYVSKLGAAGASYGGYSIYYLAGIHKNMFDAFFAHAGIFNQEHMYMTTEELWFTHWDNGGAPWDNNPIAKRHYTNSAHKFVKNWDTPIFIAHGELDYRVPVDQGMAAFNAAQLLGVPSELLLFPDENHWILKPQNAIHWQRAYFGWFDKYLK